MKSVLRRFLVNEGLAWKRLRRPWMSRHRRMSGQPYFHWPRYNGLVYLIRNLGGWMLSCILTLSLLITIQCEVINVPNYKLTVTDLYMHSRRGPRMRQVTHWVMWSRILVSYMKFTVTKWWNKSGQMQSSWAKPISITFMFLPLSHNHHRRTRPKTRSESSRV